MEPEASDPEAQPADEEFAVPSFLGPSRYSDADRAQVIQHLTEAGASEAEIAEAARTGTLGVLALDIALRPPGEMITLAEAAEEPGLSIEDAIALWRALGFAVPDDGSLRLPPPRRHSCARYSRPARR